jgi:hypothetical protein
MPICDPLYLALLLPIVLICYALPAGHWRAAFLLIVSYAYYLTFPLAFFPILVAVTLVAYVGGLLIERCRETRFFASVVTAVLLACFAPMIFYKYLIPLWSAVSDQGDGTDWGATTAAQVLFPVGLSFYTFAAAGYLADIALGLTAAERRPLTLALFCGFFPIVTQGPIPRTAGTLGQLHFKRGFDAERGMRGISEILIGAVMKVWIADSLAGPSEMVYADLANCPPLEHLVATIYFAFQIYADWAGYSLIAIGSARLLGIDIPENFRQPYLSTNMQEFWRSWNISLMNWLRDYVFTPLCLLLRRWPPRLATSVAVFITMILLGVWHAVGWGYVLYGVANGLLVVGSQWTLASRDRFWRSVGCPALLVTLFRIPATFLLVVFTDIIVRAQSLDDVLYIYSGVFSPALISNFANVFSADPDLSKSVFHHIHFNMDVLLIAALIVGDIFARTKTVPVFRFPVPARAAVYSACAIAVLYYAASPHIARPFVYFRF